MNAVSPTCHAAHNGMAGPDAYDLIRTCLSHRPDSTRREAARSLVNPDVDWEPVRQEAQRHRVLSPLFHALEHLLGTQLPTPVRNQIREHKRGLKIRNTFLVQELGRINQHLEAAGLPLLAMKGTVLARTVYGDLTARQSVDMDILVPRSQFSEVERALQDVGYEYAEKRKRLTGWRKTLSLHLDGQWQFTRAKGPFHLDVHTRVMPPRYSFPAAFDALWNRAQKVRLNDEVSVWGFSPEDRLFSLCYHGVKNQWRALKYVVDLAELIRTQPDLDWANVVEYAERTRSTRVVRLGLSLSQGIMSASLPADIRNWVQDAPMDDYSFTIEGYLQKRGSLPVLPYRERVHLQLATKDTVTHQIQYGVYSVLQHIWSVFLKP